MTDIPQDGAETSQDADPLEGAETFEENYYQTVKRLAAMKKNEADPLRKAQAKKHDVRLSTLDTDIKDARKEKQGESLGLKLKEHEPCSEPVDGAAMLGGIAGQIRRYIVLPEHIAHITALWIVHAHAFRLWHKTPRLGVSSAVMGSGKSLLLDVIATMVPRPFKVENLTSAVAFRVIDQYAPTLIADEVDTYLNDNDELRGIFNSGHDHKGQVARCDGDTNEIRAFSTFAPIATGGIGKLKGTLIDRSIQVVMERRAAGENYEQFRGDQVDHLYALASQVARWTLDHKDELKAADPGMPASIENRAADNWRPLLSIADTAAGDWPALARRAAAVLNAADDGDEEGIRVQALADTRDIFNAERADALPSTVIAVKLAEREDRPWPEFRKGHPITTTQLAGLLRPFKIRPRTIRRNDKTIKGYHLDDFKSAFDRYLRKTAVTPSQMNSFNEKDLNAAVTNSDNVTAAFNPKPLEKPECYGVTAKKPPLPDVTAIKTDPTTAEPEAEDMEHYEI